MVQNVKPTSPNVSQHGINLAAYSDPGVPLHTWHTRGSGSSRGAAGKGTRRAPVDRSTLDWSTMEAFIDPAPLPCLAGAWSGSARSTHSVPSSPVFVTGPSLHCTAPEARSPTHRLSHASAPGTASALRTAHGHAGSRSRARQCSTSGSAQAACAASAGAWGGWASRTRASSTAARRSHGSSRRATSSSSGLWGDGDDSC